ncbi:unnamed protein product [Paramecium octaurelia]|uniref:Uncharacterized protein n=1 Tax=Paramecium octaurelia TaxID=43137 RepID=A0A8S1YN61_PAROT|nr:unnamed protein product [Paramecium octaurelia]
MGTSQSNQNDDLNQEFIKVTNNNRIQKNGTYCFYGIYHYFNAVDRKWKKEQFKYIIELTPAGQLKYILDGEILRIESRIDQNKSIKILTQLEQIKSLKWVGEYNHQNLPVGKWNMIWRGEKQIFGGFYNENGKKDGRWEEPFKGYWGLCQVYFVGTYNQGLRQGKWMYQQDDQIIGGGLYNLEGQKEGIWIELHENFDRNNQIYIKGLYRNNAKIGNWFYEIKEHYSEKLLKFLGGQYQRYGIKHGKWFELRQDFDNDLKFLDFGEYYNGKKQGIWNSMWINQRETFQIIGCGLYDENGLENGYWLQLNRKQRNQWYQIKGCGKFIHGIKVGTWNTSFGCQLVGTGAYNQEGKKFGKWIQLSKNFQLDKMNIKEDALQGKLITFVGEYIDGKKSGNWQIKKGDEIIGEGLYANDGFKIGKWIELCNFRLSFFVIQIGEYQHGIKQGKWEILLRKKKGLEKIGGGWYDTQGMKHGKWISLHENYNYNCQVLDAGSYNHGIKQGRWDVKTIQFYEHDVLTYSFWPKDNFYKIAGGYYENGVKLGKWIDLDENYNYNMQILYEGEFNNDLKKGKWEMMKHHNSFIKKIGGGQYNQEGIKNLKWIELSKNQKQKLILVDYQNGIKISIQQMEKVI